MACTLTAGHRNCQFPAGVNNDGGNDPAAADGAIRHCREHIPDGGNGGRAGGNRGIVNGIAGGRSGGTGNNPYRKGFARPAVHRGGIAYLSDRLALVGETNPLLSVRCNRLVYRYRNGNKNRHNHDNDHQFNQCKTFFPLNQRHIAAPPKKRVTGHTIPRTAE